MKIKALRNVDYEAGSWTIEPGDALDAEDTIETERMINAGEVEIVKTEELRGWGEYNQIIELSDGTWYMASITS